ncbi:hypothetical protein [Verminephrobacter aporrectodeae]|uniref:hypothetical protein n=1 Tax=Verminephrobacter aporrectodeae TaxID=1110389 RepID=UPI002244E714|nr:hypothetical protein [Verminephrobacter aporrectodeae]
MKSKFTSTLFILAVTLDAANAKLGVESMTPQQADRPYAQIILKDEKAFWISAGQLSADSTVETFLVMRGMDCRSKGETRKIKMPDNYMALTPVSESVWQNALVIGANFLGEWSMVQLQANLSGIRKSLPLSDVGVIWASASSKAGYFIAGASMNKQPVLMYFSADLKTRKILSQANDGNGEVSSVFESRGRVFALFNRHGDSKDQSASPGAELREYSATGTPVSRTPLNGIASIGTALKDGGIAISYWIGEQLFMEKRDANLSILWSTKLHQSNGIASIKGYLLEAGSHIAWVGANDNKLLIHRLAQDGKSIQTSIDTKTNIGIPIPDIYSVYSSGNDIYVRGAAARSKNPPEKITEFCFTEQPDS